MMSHLKYHESRETRSAADVCYAAYICIINLLMTSRLMRLTRLLTFDVRKKIFTELKMNDMYEKKITKRQKRGTALRDENWKYESCRFR